MFIPKIHITGFLVLALLALAIFSNMVGYAQNKESQETRAEFESLMNKWKPLLKKMYNLRLEYHKYGTSLERKDVLRDDFKSMYTQCHEINRQLTELAIRAYAQSPEENKDLVNFIDQSLIYFMQTDQYEDALDLAQKILNMKIQDFRVIRNGAFAALYANDFDTAEELLNQIKELGIMNNFGISQSDFQYLKIWKEQWAREKKLREAERRAGDLPRVVLATTQGEIELELFENEAPNTVANFIYLVEKGFYTNLDFQRVIQGFVAQGGGTELLKETNLDGTLKKRGDGTPGYSIHDELGENQRMHFRGALSMANAGPNTGGSQFFITFRPNTDLDGRHTVFGRVVRGMDVPSRFVHRDPGPKPEKPGVIMPDKILSARVLKKRNHPYSPIMIPNKGQLPPFPKMPGLEDKPGDILSENWDPKKEIEQGMP